MLKRRAPFLLFLAAAAAAGQAPSRNPDRRPLLEISQGGSSPIHGALVVHSRLLPDIKEKLKTSAVSAGAVFLYPASDFWSLQAGVAGDWSEQDVVGPLTNGGTSAGKDVARGSFSARRYFRGTGASGNPDRFISLALSAGASNATHYEAGNAAGVLPKKVASGGGDFSVDARCPLSESWTATASLGRESFHSESDPAPLLNAVKSRSRTGTAEAGVRWFLGRAAGEEGDGNPDGRTMASLAAGAAKDLSARQTVTGPAGLVGHRDVETRSYSLKLGLRIPATDHLSLRFEASGVRSRSFVPILTAPLQSGSTTHLSTAGFTAAVRYFF